MDVNPQSKSIYSLHTKSNWFLDCTQTVAAIVWAEASIECNKVIPSIYSGNLLLVNS